MKIYISIILTTLITITRNYLSDVKKTSLSNQKGFLTIEFIFAFALIFGFILLIFAFSLTLTVAEIAQYIIFSSSRNYMAAHANPGAQQVVAETKFDNLIKNERLKVFFKEQGWFSLKNMEAGHNDKFLGVTGSYLFSGVRAEFRAKLLSLNIPFFASTDPEEKGLKTTLNSYLGRHPSYEECMSFNSERYKAILFNTVVNDNARVYLENIRNSEVSNQGPYVVMEDNGC